MLRSQHKLTESTDKHQDKDRCIDTSPTINGYNDDDDRIWHKMRMRDRYEAIVNVDPEDVVITRFSYVLSISTSHLYVYLCLYT